MSFHLRVFNNLLTEEQCSEFVDKFNDTHTYMDVQVTGSIINRHVLFAEEIWDAVKDRVESELDTSFHFDVGMIRKYLRGNELVRHLDTIYPHYSFSINIGQSDDVMNNLYYWQDGNKHTVQLNVGDGIVFPGSKLEHARDVLTSDYLYVSLLGLRENSKGLI